MPLIKGKSQKSFVKNLKTEMHEGKPMKQSLAIAYSMKRKAQKKADGGEVEDDTNTGPVLDPQKVADFTKGFTEQKAHGGEMGDDDLVMRIMKKRYSHGGEVANDTPPMADGEENDFDDLALDDDLEFHDTGANSGDEVGDKQEDHDRHDIVARIMASRKKKDKLPSPA